MVKDMTKHLRYALYGFNIVFNTKLVKHAEKTQPNDFLSPYLTLL